MPDESKAPALVIGTTAVGLIGLGVYFWAKKPGVQPGAGMIARFRYEHKGDAGEYYFQIMLGHIRLGVFDEVEGMLWRAKEHVDYHSSWTECEVNLEFNLPEMMDAGKYDAEASIRTLLDDKLIIRVLQESAVVVPKL